VSETVSVTLFPCGDKGILVKKKMKKVLKDKLDHSVDMAMSHGYSISKFMKLQAKAGCYSPVGKEKICHPLETIILGQKIEDYINYQIAKELQTTVQWVDGFVDGFANSKKDNRYLLFPNHYPNMATLRHLYLSGYRDGVYYQEVINELEIAYSEGAQYYDTYSGLVRR
jgi:hypothetical protein